MLSLFLGLPSLAHKAREDKGQGAMRTWGSLLASSDAGVGVGLQAMTQVHRSRVEVKEQAGTAGEGRLLRDRGDVVT